MDQGPISRRKGAAANSLLGARLDRRANQDLFSPLASTAPAPRWRGVALALAAVTMLIVAAVALLNL